MDIHGLEQKYNRMIEQGNFEEASHIAFKIAGTITEGKYGWHDPEMDEWLEAGYSKTNKDTDN